MACRTDNCGYPLETLRSGDTHFLFTNMESFIETCFQSELLLTDKIMLITPKDHPWARRDFIEVEELLEEKYILPAANTTTHNKVNEALAEKNLSLSQLNTFLTFDNPEAIALSVKKGLGLSFSSATIAATISGSVAVPIKGIDITQGLYIIRDKTQLTTSARDAFWDFIASASNEIQGSINLNIRA